MKRIVFMLTVWLALVLPAMAQQSSCSHTNKVTVSQRDGVMQFYCEECKKAIDYTSWTQPDEDFGVTLMDPFLNYEADYHDIGSQLLVVNSVNAMKQVWVMRDDDAKLLFYQGDSKKSSSMAQVTLPWYPTTCGITIVVQINLMKQEIDEEGKSEVTYHDKYAVLHAKQTPYHAIYDFKVQEVAAPDSEGIAHPFNRVSFAIREPKAQDVMVEDKLLILRAKNPDFSDAASVAVVNYSDFKYEKDGMGWFVIDDKSEEASYNTEADLTGREKSTLTNGVDTLIHRNVFSQLDQQILEGFYTHPSQPIYYKAVRAMVLTMWPSHEGAFCVRDSVNLSKQLPSVSSVEIHPSVSWQQNKKSQIKITLENPLPWEYNDLENANIIQRYLQGEDMARRRYVWDENALIRVRRFSPKEEWEHGVDQAAMEYTINGSQVKWNHEKKCWEATLDDCQALPYTHYYYTAVVERGSSNIPLAGNNISCTSSESDAELCYSKVAALINNFTATREEMPGKVQLEWSLGVGKISKLALMRRENSKNRHSDWEYLEITDPMKREFLDETALAGHAYEYKLQTTYSYRGMEIVDSALVRGWGSFRSSISGYITMPNGTAIANDTITLKRINPVFIDDVLDEDDVVLLYGYHDGVVAEVRPEHRIGEVVSGDVIYTKQITTDEKGYFEFEDLPFMGDGTKYEISFTRIYKNGGIDRSEVIYTLSNDIPEVKNQKFVCSEVATISGNVVYSESTVPVMDAHFVMEYKDQKGNILSSCILRDSKGEPIRSDANGAFAFTVPAGKLMSVRVEKEDHKFKGNGCLLLDNKEVYSPANGEHYVIPQVNDDTRIRLVGRLCGGNVEAAKQLGFSQSRNNLGDDLTIELQLEGNNTSWLVYHNDKPDDTTIHETVKHPVKQLLYEPETNVTYEKKRIIIHPDVKTGEFFVDLIPTKYRVSQLTANGYPTLYQHGEGLQVLDLNDSTQVKTIVSRNDESVHYDCHATFVRAYHIVPTVTYSQYKNGQITDYLGENKINRKDLVRGEVEYELANYDRATDKVNYTFGYPVYDAKRSYQLQAYVHEDYYYNNNQLGEVDEVPLGNGVLHVQNGLLGNNEQQSYQLNENGRVNFFFTVGNPIFGLTGEQTLRSMNISVELGGLFIEAEPLKAFVMGNREIGTDAVPMLTIPGNVYSVDILRDPPGKNSYAYRESGTTYQFDRNYLKEVVSDFKLDAALGVHAKGSTGVGIGLTVNTDMYEVKVLANGHLSVPMQRDNTKKQGSYTMKLNERIQTSSDALDAGAMADVYVGLVTTQNLLSTEGYTVLNEQEYNEVKTNVDNGVFKLISTGKDSKGAKNYMVVNRQITMQEGIERNFVYSQKHILGTVIPELERQKEALLHDKNTNNGYLKDLANAKLTPQYKRTDDTKGYEVIYPDGNGSYVDSVGVLKTTIDNWQKLIERNESAKVGKIKNSANPYKKYSVAGSSISYNESSTCYYSERTWEGNMHVSGGGGASMDSEPKGHQSDKTTNNAAVGNPEDENYRPAEKVQEVKLVGFLLKIGFDFSGTQSETDTQTEVKTNSAGYGFQLTTNDNGYMDVDVYADVDTIVQKTYEKLTWTRDLNTIPINDGKSVHDMVFAIRGGAARNPYYEPDSTLFYKENGESVALGTRMLKIDNPRIYIDHPVINNQPEDESASVRIRLVNESEINDKTQYLNASVFKLKYDDKTNPNGAEILLDGQSLAVPKEIRLAPGQSMEKTLKINRGVGYNFENMRIVFQDNANSLKDYADVSVHYLPVASAVELTAPENQWTMNTLSPYDEKGYYIPVTIDGFNVNSDGFHHIELQYKKKTDGESKWTSVCAYYNDSTFYHEATGTKEMIPATGRIGVLKFYGEKDPVEMEYDLRAVAFRKLGTTLISRSSAVASGRKDTRNPRVFGSPKPANGILTYADVISIPFNEPIADNYLDKIANFQVTGRTNNSLNQYSTALYFPKSVNYPTELKNEESYFDSLYTYMREVKDAPMSKVKMSMDGNDFTVDMMVRLSDKPKSGINLFCIMDPDEASKTSKTSNDALGNNYILLSMLHDNSLMFSCGGVLYTSEPINDIDFTNFQRVGMTFEHEPHEGQPQVRFYVNGVEKKIASFYIKSNYTTKLEDVCNSENYIFCHGYGNISVGEYMDGAAVTDVRLWNRTLPPYEVTQKRNILVSDNELGLVGYWPMDEGTGNVAHDIVNGVDLYFTRQSWRSTDTQYSLALNKKKVELKVDEIERPQSYDYTLSLWARADELLSDSVSVLTSGDKASQFFRLGTQDGYLSVTTISDEEGQYTHHIVPEGTFKDGAWHHIAVVANKSQNLAATYFDGNLTETFSGTELGGISHFNVFMGDATFVGNLDNLQLWDHAFPANSVSTMRKRSATGYEMGILLNLPFEQTLLNEQGTRYTAFSPLNTVYRKKESSSNYLPLEEAFTATPELEDNINVSPAQPSVGEKNIDFDWTSTSNELQIHLLTPDDEINHQNVNVVIRSVEDLAGNSMLNPKRMVLYVDKNVLVWKDKSISLKTAYGTGVTQTLKFENISGQELYYNIREHCKWLSLDKTEGYLSPRGEEEVELTISDDLAPGEYNTTINLVDENKLCSQMTIRLTVEAQEPDWMPTTDAEYNQVMNLIGKVYVTNNAGDQYVDNDKRDIVYAFYDGVCLGKANISVQNDEPFVFMTIRGKQSMNQNRAERTPAAPIDFRLWRASTGNVTYISGKYTDEAGKEHTKVGFAQNTIVGSHTSPVQFRENGNAIQSFNLKKGWNWISMNVRPYQNEGVNGLFESTAPFTEGDIINTMGGAHASYMQSDGIWGSGKDALPYEQSNVYQVYVHNDCVANVVGVEFNDDNRVVNIKNTGWNNLAYLRNTDLPLSKALADYMANGNAQDHAVVMSRNEFAQLEGGKWYGSLEYLHPGQGYYLYHLGKPNIEIHYYDDTHNNPAKAVRRKARSAADVTNIVAQSGKYMTSMGVIAAVAEDNDMEASDELVAYVGEEEVGRCRMMELEDGRQRYFIMLSAAPGSSIVWAQERNGETIASVNSSVRYSGTSVAGDISRPLVIDFRQGKDSSASVQYYTTDGVRTTDEGSQQRRILLGTDGSKKIK